MKGAKKMSIAKFMTFAPPEEFRRRDEKDGWYSVRREYEAAREPPLPDIKSEELVLLTSSASVSTSRRSSVMLERNVNGRGSSISNWYSRISHE